MMPWEDFLHKNLFPRGKWAHFGESGGQQQSSGHGKKKSPAKRGLFFHLERTD